MLAIEHEEDRQLEVIDGSTNTRDMRSLVQEGLYITHDLCKDIDFGEFCLELYFCNQPSTICCDRFCMVRMWRQVSSEVGFQRQRMAS